MSSNIDVDIVAKDDAVIADVPSIGTSCSHKTATSQVHEEYKDSLEFDAVIKESNRINDDDDDVDTEGELFDTVEQDSLETTKIESTKMIDGTNEFLPFAHIGTSWPNECATAQPNTQQLNSSTNQIVENVLTNQTNAFDDDTNNTITTKHSIEFDFQDLPGT